MTHPGHPVINPEPGEGFERGDAHWQEGGPPPGLLHTITGIVSATGANWGIGVNVAGSNVDPTTVEGVTVRVLANQGDNNLKLDFDEVLPSIGTGDIIGRIVELDDWRQIPWQVANLRYQGTWNGLKALLAPMVGQPITFELWNPAQPPTLVAQDETIGQWNESHWRGIIGDPGVQFKVEMAIASFGGEGGFTYDDPGSLYGPFAGEATYAESDLTWLDLTARVLAVSGGRGRGKLGEGFRPGQGTLELNNQDGVFNPQRSINIVGDQAMRPGRLVRLSARKSSDQDADYTPLWYMRVQSLADVYESAAHGINSVWRLVGLETILSQDQPPPLEVADPATAGQTADERARYIWETLESRAPALLVTPDTYDKPMIATTFPGSRYSQFLDASEAEGGDFYVAKDGRFFMRGRDWLDPDDPPLFEIGAYDQTEAVVLDATTAWDMTRIRNDISLTREGGTLQRGNNTSSIGVYGALSWNQSGLQNDNDVDVAELVQFYLGRFAWDTMRLESVEVWSPREAGVQQLLDVEVGDVVQVEVITGGGWSYAVKAWVNEVRHSVTADDWRVSLRLDNTFRGDPRQSGPFSAAYSDAYNHVPYP